MFERFEHLGEVPKLAEGTPLERVQAVNSRARVQIPSSPLKEKESVHRAGSFFVPGSALSGSNLSDRSFPDAVLGPSSVVKFRTIHKICIE